MDRKKQPVQRRVHTRRSVDGFMRPKPVQVQTGMPFRQTESTVQSHQAPAVKKSRFKARLKKINMLLSAAKQLASRAVNRLKHLNRHHPDRLRLAGLALLLVVVALPLSLHERSQRQQAYQLSPGVKQLVGPVNDSLNQKLTHDPKQGLFQYNKDALSSSAPDSPQAALAQAQKGQKIGGGADNYAVDLAARVSGSGKQLRGITIHDTTDTTGQLRLSLIPNFSTRDGKLLDGRVVYPLKTRDAQLVYTVKANGLKEDLVLDKPQGNQLSFSYTLQLPDNLQAKQQPDGSIGIYSADPALFGNISFGSDADRAKVEAARKNGEKTNLVFIIPAPVIVQTGKGSDAPKASFSLKGDQLTVTATNLDQASYPIAIDPSVAVNSASKFNQGNFEGGTEIDTSGYLRRSALSGGSVSATGWAATSGGSMSAGHHQHATVAYSGYLYVLGGYNPTNASTDVLYAPINSNTGDIGGWANANTSSSFTTARVGLTAVAYNGYMYIMAGRIGGGAYLNDVQYAKINSNGTVGAWANANTGATFSARTFPGTVVSNGYVYIIGGCSTDNIISCTTTLGDVQYAAIQADGRLGAWSSANTGASFTTTRWFMGVSVYNGYLYIAGGNNSSSGLLNDVQYVAINSNGTLGSWKTATSFSGARQGLNAGAHKGYMYVFGGQISGGNATNDVQYASINADGSLGAWSATTSFNTARWQAGSAIYNGYIYVTGGTDGGQTNKYADTQYANIDTAGALGKFTNNSSTFTNARYGNSSVSYNGYLYVLGGTPNSGGTTYADTYYAPINSDGSVGTWTATTSMATSRTGFTAFAYNGYVYALGGYNSSGGPQASTEYAALNSNGTIGTWNTTNTFSGGRYGHGMAVSNGFVYVMGGCTAQIPFTGCSSLASDIQYAPINSNGTLGTWNSTTGIGNSLEYLSATASGGYIYISGGWTGSALSNTVKYALICTGSNSGTDGCGGTAGTLGTMHTTTSFSTARQLHKTIAYNGYLYVIGGDTSNGAYGCGAPLATVEYAPINSDGTISSGAWKTTTSLTGGSCDAGMAVNKNILYVAGGAQTINGGTQHNDSQYAPFNNGGPGTTGSWTTNANNLAATRNAATTVAYNGYIYAIGGTSSTPVEYAQILSNGSVGTWAATSSYLGSGRTYPVSAVYNGYIYMIGGYIGGNALADVQFAPINSNGTLGAWHYTHAGLDDNTTASTALTTARFAHGVAQYNGYIYVSGGCTSYNTLNQNCQGYTNTTEFAPICTGSNSGTAGCTSVAGPIGTFTTASNSFTSARMGGRSIAYNGYLYVMSGCTSYNGLTGCGSGAYLNDVQFASLNPSTGAVGTWSYTNGFAIGRYLPSIGSANGYMYIATGIGVGGTNQADVQYVSINSNGTLGSWQATTSLAAGRWGSGNAVYNGYLYLVGGHTGNNDLQDTVYAGLQAIPRKGTYSYLTDQGGDAVATKLLMRGTVTTNSVLSFLMKEAANASPTFGSSTLYSPTLGSLLSITASEKRYRQLAFSLDDSQSAFFPDSLTTATTIQDFELYFHPASAKRLRGGKTFTGETQRSLDAQPQ